MAVLIVTTEKSGMDRYSQELGKRTKTQALVAIRYFSLRQSYRFSRALRSIDDVVHLPNQHFGRYALFLKKPFLITVHDLARICFDFDRETVRERLLLKLDVRGIKKAAHIIAVSQHTKNDLVKYLKIAEQKITVVYNGLDHRIFRPAVARVLDKPYILYVGSERPRKNLGRLLQAFSKIRGDFPGLKLVKVGSPGREYGFRKAKLEQIENLGLGEDVIFADFVPDKKLPGYYSSASALVYPSLYEGFGLPPLEAMACGCPVIASNTSSLPEVVGNAAILVDPYDVDGLAQAMAQVLSSEVLRDEMIIKGFIQAKKFSWEKAAEETLEVYKKRGI